MTSQPTVDNRFVAGFILNKLYQGRCYARRKSSKHGKHIRLSSLPTGLLPEKGDAIFVAKQLNGNLIKIFKATGDDHVCALLDNDAVEAGLVLCNYFRQQVRLPPLDRMFREALQQAQKEEAKEEEYRKLTDKEKRNKEYLERVKKWAVDEGLASQSS